METLLNDLSNTYQNKDKTTEQSEHRAIQKYLRKKALTLNVNI